YQCALARTAAPLADTTLPSNCARLKASGIRRSARARRPSLRRTVSSPLTTQAWCARSSGLSFINDLSSEPAAATSLASKTRKIEKIAIHPRSEERRVGKEGTSPGTARQRTERACDWY